MNIDLTDFQNCLEYEHNRKLTGVKFIFSEQDYDTCTVPEASHQLFFCMMVKIGASGKHMKVKKEHIYCSAARQILGFSSPTLDILSGKTPYERGMYCSQSIAENVQQQLPYLEHRPFGMLIGPVETFEAIPDIVLSISSPYTAMRILQAYAYLYGSPANLRMAGMGGVCTELMAQAYKSQDINLSLLCSNTRFSCSWKDHEVGIAMPYTMFDKVKDSVVQTMNIFESHQKKRDILRRVEQTGSTAEMPPVHIDSNYFDSCLGVAKPGVTGYHKRGEDS